MASAGSKKRLIVPALLLFVYSNLILRFPLFDYLGYEFSVAVALVAPWLSWILVKHFLRKQFVSPEERTISNLRRYAADAQLSSFILLAIPFCSATANVLFTKNCSFAEGAMFYLLIPVVSSVWTTGLTVVCVVAFRRPLRWYALFLTCCFLYPFSLGYFYPQIYSYNFVYRYFPGFSYDETMSITMAILLFSLLTILVGVLLYLIAEEIVFQRSERAHQARSSSLLRRGIIIFLAGCTLGAWMFRSDLGFESPAHFIQRQLGGAYESEHFTIYYSKRTFSDDEIRYVAAMHEFRFHQVQTALNVHGIQHIASYLYPDSDVKRKFIGTGNTNIAKPWRREVHLNKDSWEGTLKHELVHALAGEFGMPVIKAHYNTGLIEGLAMAIDDDFGNRTLNEYAAAMMKFELIKDPARLVRPIGFALQSSSVSYVMMGSFIRYLIDGYGVDRFKELYGGRSPDDIYGAGYEALAQDWLRFLSSIEVPESSRNHVEFYFNRPSIFAKNCAHAVANKNEEGRRLLEKNSPVGAMSRFQAGLRMSWNSESFAGLVRSSFAAARYDSVISLMDVQLQDSLRRISVIHLYVPYGDALWYRNDYITARRVYLDLASYDLTEWMSESGVLRTVILDHQQLRMTLADYVVGSMDDSSALSLFDILDLGTLQPAVRYLRAKLNFRKMKYRDAVTQFESIHESLDYPILNARKEQLLGEAYFHLHEYRKASANFQQALKFITNKSYIKRIGDWIERCEWFEQNGERFLK